MNPNELRFFNPFAEIERTANYLPHWQQPGATYFITFRLRDALPAALRDQWLDERTAWLASHPKPWSPKVEMEYHRRFSARMDEWLDAGHGACVLRAGACREIVEATLRHLDGGEYFHHASVVMPNHAHILVSLAAGSRLETTVSAWKSVASRRINRSLGRGGALWQEDYFDRLIRDETHFGNCARYIRGNPAKARLREGEFTLYESEMVEGL